MPASAGPTARARLNCTELSEIAFNKCSGPTRDGTTLFIAGV
jgi:hypothetical protein